MLQGEHEKLLEKLRAMVPADLATIAKQRIAELGADDQDSEDRIQFADDDIDELQEEDVEADASERTVVGREVYVLSSDPVLQKICEIDRLAAKLRLESEMKMLKGNRGNDFDVNFIGLQITTHSNLLAELKAMKNVGTPEFQKIVAKATKTVASHLEQAQEIAFEIGANAEQDDEEKEDDFGYDDDDDDGSSN